MRYSELADIYEKLEGTSSKLAKTEIISSVLKRAPAKLLPKLVLLLSGRIFPPWSAEEIGVANKLMMRAIARAIGISEDAVVKKFRQTGDLGSTAEGFIAKKAQRVLMAKALDVESVFDTAQSIAKQAGKGSQEKKLNLITQLLASAKPKEARYIVRMVLEELRVGVADGIIRDAISKAFEIPVNVVESAWNVRPDYGEIAEIAKRGGEPELKKMKIELGTPMMVQLAEKAPNLKSAIEAFDRCVLEYKYDGARLSIHKKGNKIWLYTRRLENITDAFPDIVEMVLKAVKARNCIIEGEGVAIDQKTGRPLPFQRLSQRIKRKYDIKQIAKEIPTKLYLFDIIYLNGKSLFGKKLSDRIETLKKVVKPIPREVFFANGIITKDLKKAEAFYKESLKEGQEGLMVKNLDAMYVPGRRVAGGWLKVKPVMETLDLAIIGATWGTGKRAGWLGSFILGCRDKTGKFAGCGMLGTGIKEKKTNPDDVTFAGMTKMLKPQIEQQKGNQVKIKPKVIIEVAYEEIQKSTTYASGFALRFPRFIRIRWDKSAQQADTIERIKTLFDMQKGKGI